jgi:RNA-binding protein
MSLSESQKKYLRGLGHQLKPVITVADTGLSASILREFDATISHHELIKVRFRMANRDSRDTMIDELCRQGSGNLIQRIGNVALIYRPNPDEQRIRLP